MTGVALNIEISGGQAINDRLQTLESRAGDLSLIWPDIGEYLLLAHDDRFRDQVDPKGEKWMPLSEEYLNSKRKRESAGADKILVLDGYMSGGLTYKYDANSLQLGSNAVYAARQQFDYEREFIGLSSDDEDEIYSLVGEYLSGE
jgi:phage gpG-like protein